ncbi:MAG TPA: response regulator [Phycisphaerae bacterium]|jgi:two-component system nitrogen regulation response regulator GlnG|nr:response regulator [Phycisphaerae bacterium]HPM24729.1 response regulator [Phycisphaerae bacterium]HQL55283.1 response regulator [Phycisphaerae bacterium]
MRRSILIADDDDAIRQVMRIALQQAGYDVCEATNGAEAIRAMHATPFDLVITDVLMPESDGLEMIMHVRRQNPNIKVLAISGADNALFLANAAGLGATQVLRKPFRVSALLTLVADLLPAPTRT